MYVVMTCSLYTEKVKIRSTGILFAVVNFSFCSSHWNLLKPEMMSTFTPCQEVVFGPQMSQLKALPRSQKYLKSQKAVHLSVPTDKILDQVLTTPDVKSLWKSIIADLDSQVSNECSKLALENFIKLYVQVRSFSHARDIVNKYKLKEGGLEEKGFEKGT